MKADKNRVQSQITSKMYQFLFKVNSLPFRGENLSKIRSQVYLGLFNTYVKIRLKYDANFQPFLKRCYLVIFFSPV